MVQRLEVTETAVESIQTDVRQLTDERENIRNTFNDLTVKLINSQVCSTHPPTAWRVRSIRAVMCRPRWINPLKCSGVRQLHLKVFNAILV